MPYLKDYKPEGTGRGPLANHPEFYETVCPVCGSKAHRETDVLDTFVDSSWYFLRYPSVRSAHSGQVPFDSEITKKWLPVDLYFGGAEHSVLHLMYARFVTMVLFDLGRIEFDEPFPRFFAHGLMIKGGAKMSKSRGNVVNPDEYVKKFGADTLRLYLMFMGPMDGYPDFRDTGIEGMRRFVERIWDLYVNFSDVVLVEEKESKEVLASMHRTIRKVTEDIEHFRYNTAISAIMEFVNLLRDISQKPKVKSQKSNLKCAEWQEALRTLALLIAPFAPHLAEEVWVNILGQPFSVHKAAWPRHDLDMVKEETTTVVIEVNGKLRGTLVLSREKALNEADVVSLAKKDSGISKWLKEREIKKTIFVPGKLLNFVIK